MTCLLVCAFLFEVLPAHSNDQKSSGPDIARIDGRPAAIDGFGPLSVPATARALTLGFTPEAGRRKRFRLDGVDSAWREGPGEMSLTVRFADANGEQIAHVAFRIAGESAGWTFDLQRPVFVHRHETIIVPPQANTFWLEFSSAGPPETLGVALVSDLAVTRVDANGSSGILLSGPHGRQVDTRFPGAIAPEGFISDGPRPSMARLLTFPNPLSTIPSECFAIIDEDATTHAEWHSIKQEGPHVVPGESLTVAWNEACSVGYGYHVEESYASPPAGEYRFRLQTLDLFGRPVGPESSLLIRVLAPWWKWPSVWAAMLAVLIAGVVTLARHLAQRRIHEQLVRLKEERLIEQERLRIAREIHDTLAQGFTGIIIQLEAAEDAQLRGLAHESADHLRSARELARESLQEARRSVLALRPQVLDGRGLPEALRELFQKLTAGTSVQAELKVAGEPRPLASAVEQNLLRIALEALTNVLRHARARKFSAQLDFEAEAVRLELRDDGCGFDPDVNHEGFGLMGMKERTEAMAGRLFINSATGLGTTICLVLPRIKSDELPQTT